jgi:hypothetical protein
MSSSSSSDGFGELSTRSVDRPEHVLARPIPAPVFGRRVPSSSSRRQKGKEVRRTNTAVSEATLPTVFGRGEPSASPALPVVTPVTANLVPYRGAASTSTAYSELLRKYESTRAAADIYKDRLEKMSALVGVLVAAVERSRVVADAIEYGVESAKLTATAPYPFLTRGVVADPIRAAEEAIGELNRQTTRLLQVVKDQPGLYEDDVASELSSLAAFDIPLVPANLF